MSTEAVVHPLASEEMSKLDEKVVAKFSELMRSLSNTDKLPSKKFKALGRNGFYELRVKNDKQIYRGIGCWRQSKFILLVVYHKQEQKLPKRILALSVTRLLTLRI